MMQCSLSTIVWMVSKMITNKIFFLVSLLLSEAVLANTPTECDYLKDSSLPTRGWVNQYDDEYGCSSDYLNIGTGSPLPNNIAYYVEGDTDSAKSAKLVMNINNKGLEKNAKAALINAAQNLSKKIINTKLPDSVLSAIKNGQENSVSVENKSIHVKRNSWPSGNGHEVHIIFTLKE